MYSHYYYCSYNFHIVFFLFFFIILYFDFLLCWICNIDMLLLCDIWKNCSPVYLKVALRCYQGLINQSISLSLSLSLSLSVFFLTENYWTSRKKIVIAGNWKKNVRWGEFYVSGCSLGFQLNIIFWFSATKLFCRDAIVCFGRIYMLHWDIFVRCLLRNFLGFAISVKRPMR